MKLSADSEIPLPKLLQYLLVPLGRADKSKFLARAGYTTENPADLIADIRSQILPLDGRPAGSTKFGDFSEIRGVLRGPALLVRWGRCDALDSSRACGRLPSPAWPRTWCYGRWSPRN